VKKDILYDPTENYVRKVIRYFEEIRTEEREEELIQLLEAMIEKVKAGDFDEVIKDSRDFAALAHKAKDLADKLPDMGK
jgi:DNA-binding GntR family transcriptional regulator